LIAPKPNQHFIPETRLTSIPTPIRFLLATLFINAICFGIIVPVTPALVMHLGGGNLREATVIGGELAIAFAACQFIFAPVLGNISDAIGRRPVIIVSLLGFAVEFCMMALATNLTWLFVARILSGIFAATQAPAQSSIADISAPEERGRYFALMGAAFGIGFVIGPAIGGGLGELGTRVPFTVASGLIALNFLMGLIFCKETLLPENRRPFDWRRANPLGSFLQVRRMKGVLGLALIYVLWQLASLVYPMIWPFFTMARWGWSPGTIGMSLALVGLGMAATNMLITPRLLPRLGERKTALLSMGVGAATMFAYAFVQSEWLGFLLIAPMTFQSMTHPALTAMLSRAGKADSQGEMQGFASSIMALGSLAAPALYFPLQNFFTGPGAPVQFDGAAMVAAGLCAGAAWLLLSLRASPPA
jgi:MFS transporter, DHA1 family, tetracycline resistance protein